MLGEEELRERCLGVRDETIPVDEQMLADIEAEVAEYRGYLTEPRPQLPPEALASRLPLMGWLINEASLVTLQQVEAAFESLPDDRRKLSEAADRLAVRLADAARALPWPEFAPRALGAIRTQALTASKRDTQRGYDEAWLLHQEARRKYDIFLESHADKQPRDWYRLALEETRVQLALAETGTACRTAELVIGRWSEEVDKQSWVDTEDSRWTQRMVRELAAGVGTGEEALALVTTIDRAYGLVARVDENRQALVTSYQNPAIMTARAALLILSMCPEMDIAGRRPLWDHKTWTAVSDDLLGRFEQAYRKIEQPAYGSDGQPLPLKMSHARSLVQLRLHLALVRPGHVLPAELRFHPCLGLDILDDEAVEAMSRWLAEIVDGRKRGDGNIIGSATKPGFIRSVEKCRAIRGVTSGYREWRRRWFELDRHADEQGRRQRVENALDAGR